MKSLVIGFCFAALGLAPLAGSAEEALVWCFNDPYITTFDGTKIKAGDVVGADGKTINAIRMKAIDGSGSSYLKLYAGDGAEFLPLGDALAMPSVDGWVLEPLYAGLGDSYAHDGVKFMIELGAYSNGDWTVLANSSLADYSALVSEHIQQMSTTATPASAWGDASFSIPEPTGATLLLWGVALLGLRRKSRA